MASGNGNTAKRLSLVGPDKETFGYGRMCVSLRESLNKYVTLDKQAEKVVYAMQPNMIKGWYKGQRPAILTMWETDTLPELFYRYLEQYDTVIVPSMHNFDLFSKHHDNVHMIPLGVDRTVWFPEPFVGDGKFRILCGGSNFLRKGLDVALDVFNRLALPDAELHIKIVHPFLDAPKQLDFPNVIVHRELMPLVDEVALMRQADLFVAPSRGEGFGLMPLQAISMGIPVVLTDAHGHREFSDLATHRLSSVPSPATLGRWPQVGTWYEPDRDELADAILDVYNNRKKYRLKAIKTAPETAAFSWDAAAQQLIQIMKPTEHPVGDDWVIANEVTTPIRVKRRVQATIGKHTVDLAPGIEHHVVLNVRDVLQEAGMLICQW